MNGVRAFGTALPLFVGNSRPVLTTREALQRLTTGGHSWAGLAKLAGYPSPIDVDEALSDYLQADTQRPLSELTVPAAAVLDKLARARSEDLGDRCASREAAVQTQVFGVE